MTDDAQVTELTRIVEQILAPRVVAGFVREQQQPEQTGTRRRRFAESPGPVTLTLRIVSRPLSRPWRTVMRAWPVLPVLALIPALLHGSAQLNHYAGRVLGLDATLCLVACLLMTPLVTIMKTRGAAKLRWWYGIWVFMLGATGLAIVETAAGPGSLAVRSAGTAVNWTGLLIVVLLLPMTITSNVLAQRLLGPEWKRWQRGLIWWVWALVAIHLVLLRHYPVTVAFLAATAPLIVLRMSRVRRSVKAWRASRYESGWWWIGISVLGLVFTTGLATLIVQEVMACVASA